MVPDHPHHTPYNRHKTRLFYTSSSLITRIVSQPFNKVKDFISLLPLSVKRFPDRIPKQIRPSPLPRYGSQTQPTTRTQQQRQPQQQPYASRTLSLPHSPHLSSQSVHQFRPSTGHVHRTPPHGHLTTPILLTLPKLKPLINSIPIITINHDSYLYRNRTTVPPRYLNRHTHFPSLKPPDRWRLSTLSHTPHKKSSKEIDKLS